MVSNLIPILGVGAIISGGIFFALFRNWSISSWPARIGLSAIATIIAGITIAAFVGAANSHNPHVWDGAGCAHARPEAGQC
jgi:hypothetical protein